MLAAAMAGLAGGANQVTFGAAGTGAAADSATPIPVPYPSGIASGHFLLLHVAALDTLAGTPTLTTPSGWTLLNSSTNSDIVSALYWKTADGTETGNLDVTFGGVNTVAFGRMYRFSHGTGVEAAASAFDGTADTSVSAVDVTTTVAKAMAVQCVWATDNVTIGAFSGESGADYTEAVAEFTDATMGSLSCQTAEVSTATAITGGTLTLGGASTDITHGFAIKP